MATAAPMFPRRNVSGNGQATGGRRAPVPPAKKVTKQSNGADPRGYNRAKSPVKIVKKKTQRPQRDSYPPIPGKTTGY